MDGFLQMKEKVSEQSLQNVFNTPLPEWGCVTEALTGEEKVPIGKIPHGLKMKS